MHDGLAEALGECDTVKNPQRTRRFCPVHSYAGHVSSVKYYRRNSLQVANHDSIMKSPVFY